MTLKTLTKIVAPVMGKAAFQLKKHGPDILLGAGLLGFVGTNVLTAKSTLKLEDKLSYFKDELNELEVAKEEGLPVSGMSYARTYAKHSLALIRLYTPSILLGGLSLAALIGSNKILKDRNIALMAAYKTVSTAYSKYREKVVEKFGEEADEKLAHFVERKDIQKSKDGDTEVEEEVIKYDPVIKGASPYARFFDELSVQWQKQELYNLTFLRAQESYFNDVLIARGHVFLNEVYDALGIPRTKAGQVVGWKHGGKGDNIIDFGIYDISDPSKRAFVNGLENSILLDFNVDGVIYDDIE